MVCETALPGSAAKPISVAIKIPAVNKAILLFIFLPPYWLKAMLSLPTIPSPPSPPFLTLHVAGCSLLVGISDPALQGDMQPATSNNLV
jgi:hypothetical protein